MKLNPIVVFALIIGLTLAVYFAVYRRRERYVQEDVDPAEVKGMTKVTFYDNKDTKYYDDIVVDGKYISFKGKNENGTDYYLTIKDGEITNTNIIKPQGDYKFRLVKSLTGDDGYYSIAVADSQKYIMIDMTNNDAGVVDLTGVEDLSSKVTEPKSFNYRFSKP